MDSWTRVRVEVNETYSTRHDEKSWSEMISKPVKKSLSSHGQKSSLPSSGPAGIPYRRHRKLGSLTLLAHPSVSNTVVVEQYSPSARPLSSPAWLARLACPLFWSQ